MNKNKQQQQKNIAPRNNYQLQQKQQLQPTTKRAVEGAVGAAQAGWLQYTNNE